MSEHKGPPFPDPKVEDVLRMPSATDAEIERKRAAAQRWLVQFCARARFYLNVTDLRPSAERKPECAEKIGLIRRLLPADEIECILAVAPDADEQGP